MAVGDPQHPHKQAILLSLFQTKEEKAFDLQVTVGEAISCVAAGSLSTASHDQWKLVCSEEQRCVECVVTISLTHGDHITNSW